MKLNTQVRDIIPPPIVSLYRMAAPYRQSGKLVDCSQAVPSYGPPEALLDAVRGSLSDPGVHRYTPDPGTDKLREAIAAKLRNFNRLSASADNVIVTAGANMAYLLTVMSLLDPGDEMLLLTPYYFNHHMALSMIGARPVEVPLDPDTGFALEPERIKRAITPHTRAVTIVTPSNPTGTVYSKQSLEALADALSETGLAVISDETYEYFTPGPFGTGHCSFGSLPAMADRTFTISSFSKTFGITGWRVGYVAAPAGCVDDMLKVHDTMVICAPHISQRGAAAGLERGMEWLEQRAGEMNKKLDWLRSWRFSNGCFEVTSSGAFFAYLRHHFNQDSFAVARLLLEEKQVLVIPGQVFGSGQEHFLRVALGGVDIPGLEKAMKRLDNLE